MFTLLLVAYLPDKVNFQCLPILLVAPLIKLIVIENAIE